MPFLNRRRSLSISRAYIGHYALLFNGRAGEVLFVHAFAPKAIGEFFSIRRIVFVDEILQS
jgi:hypothetical protein